MTTMQVVQHNVQVTDSGEVRSIFSACCAGEQVTIQQRGWTVEVIAHDGSVRRGVGRKPWATQEEAETAVKGIADKVGATFIPSR